MSLHAPPVDEQATRELLVEFPDFHRGCPHGGGIWARPATAASSSRQAASIRSVSGPTSSSSSTRRRPMVARRTATICARASATPSSAWRIGDVARGASSIRTPVGGAGRRPGRRRRQGPSRDPRPRDAQGHPRRDEHGCPSRPGHPQHAARARARQPARGASRRHALRGGARGRGPRPRQVHLGRRHPRRQAPHGGLSLPVRSHGRGGAAASRRNEHEPTRGTGTRDLSHLTEDRRRRPRR